MCDKFYDLHHGYDVEEHLLGSLQKVQVKGNRLHQHSQKIQYQRRVIKQAVLEEMEEARPESGDKHDPPIQDDNRQPVFLNWNQGLGDRDIHRLF